MNSKQFLILGGLILAILGILGLRGVLGPTTADSIFNTGWWFNPAESWAHLLAGLVALFSVFMLPRKTHRWIAITIGIIGVFFGLYNFVSTSFGSVLLEFPADLIVHLVIGMWGLWAAFNRRWSPNKSG
jgi:hypothetical protein